jgi:hypothetical protein
MNPAQYLFISHLESGAFQVGLAKGMWGNLDLDLGCPTWPIAYLWVAAAAKPECPDRYTFRFDLTGYSAIAPTALPWEMEKSMQLAADRWPKGQSHIPVIFNPLWRGRSLYAPCDRGAELPGHPAWKTAHPEYYWQSTFTIVKYLQFLYEILHSHEYTCI